MADNLFWCSNKDCNYHTMQPEKNIADKAEDADGSRFHLCKDCKARGFYLDKGIVIRRRKK